MILTSTFSLDLSLYLFLSPHLPQPSPPKAEFDRTVATELYDHGADDGSDMDFLVANVVHDPSNAAVVADMAKVVREGWKPQRPARLVQIKMDGAPSKAQVDAFGFSSSKQFTES